MLESWVHYCCDEIANPGNAYIKSAVQVPEEKKVAQEALNLNLPSVVTYVERLCYLLGIDRYCSNLSYSGNALPLPNLRSILVLIRHVRSCRFFALCRSNPIHGRCQHLKATYSFTSNVVLSLLKPT